MIELVATLGYVLVTALAGLITVGIIYARWNYGTLERIKGLPAVVKPAFVGGSDIHIHTRIVHDKDQENVNKYGKVFGYYEGRVPHIYVADVDMIRKILVKDFDHFHNKRQFDFGHILINEMLDVLPYDKWKVVRNFLSPTLTTGKIRNMSVLMTEAINDWMEAVKEKMDNNEPFITKRMYTALTSDIIARCGFGLKLNSMLDPNNVFAQQVQNMVSEEAHANFILPLSHVFPGLMRLIPFFPAESLEFLDNVIQSAIKSRQGSNAKINDFIDCLIEMTRLLSTEEYKRLGITSQTVTSQALLFFFAGFETTAFTLSSLTYQLSQNPSIQDKLLEEVDEYLTRHNGKVEHEHLGELTYMNACIHETLRMYAPLIRLERVCTRDWTYEPTGLRIPAGMIIQVPVPAVHFNPEYYPDPHTFKPERFLPENKDKLNPYAFLGFGQGNHNCIGMRFAKEELFIALTTILKHFKFRATSSTKVNFIPGRNLLLAVEPFSVEAIKRY